MATSLSPDRAIDGRFGPYGGRYVPETLLAAPSWLAFGLLLVAFNIITITAP